MVEKRIVKKKETGGTPKAPEKAPEKRTPRGPGGVTIISGPMVDTLGDLVGMKVSEAADTFGPSYGAAPGSTILVNGKTVPDDILLSEGDTMEFVRRAGEKGAMPRQNTRVVLTRTEAGEKCLFVGQFSVKSLEMKPSNNSVTVKAKNPDGRTVTASFTPSAPSQSATTDGLLHPWLRQVMSNGFQDVLVIECPPHARTVLVGQNFLEPNTISPTWENEYGPYQNVFLAFPWLVLIVTTMEQKHIVEMQAYYRTERLHPGSMSLCTTNLLNVTPHRVQVKDNHSCVRQQVCLGDASTFPKGPNWAWAAVEEAVHRFFRNGFNGSAHSHMWGETTGPHHALDAKVGSFRAWESNSRKDPDFILHVPWRSASMTVDECLKSTTDNPYMRHVPGTHTEVFCRRNADKIAKALYTGGI